MADWYDTYKSHTSEPFIPMTLSPEEEKQFKSWLQDLQWYKDIQARVPKEVNLFDELTGPGADYDYRRAYKAGITPALYKYDSTYHWPSSLADGTMLKAPDHDTAWMEYFMREMNVDPNAFGLPNPEAARTWTHQLYGVMDKYPKLWTY